MLPFPLLGPLGGKVGRLPVRPYYRDLPPLFLSVLLHPPPSLKLGRRDASGKVSGRALFLRLGHVLWRSPRLVQARRQDFYEEPGQTYITLSSFRLESGFKDSLK